MDFLTFHVSDVHTQNYGFQKISLTFMNQPSHVASVWILMLIRMEEYAYCELQRCFHFPHQPRFKSRLVLKIELNVLFVIPQSVQANYTPFC